MTCQKFGRGVYPICSFVALTIVHADARLVVVEKPPGLLSVPGKGPANADCVSARVRTMFPHATGPMVVHRLDMDTSGLIVVALDADAQRELSRQFEQRLVEKKYVAILQGVLERDEGEISLPLRPDVENRPYQIVDHVHGRHALTRYRVLAREEHRTRVEFVPVTGRAHQLRVHAADPVYRGPPGAVPRDMSGEHGQQRGLGHPILGDVLYGDPCTASRLLLHASYISFLHPCGGGRVEFESAWSF